MKQLRKTWLGLYFRDIGVRAQSAADALLSSANAAVKELADAKRTRKARAIPLEKAEDVLRTDKRIKNLRAKLNKIASTKQRAAQGEKWIEQSELAQVEFEEKYQAELEALLAKDMPRNSTTVKVLKERVKRHSKQ